MRKRWALVPERRARGIALVLLWTGSYGARIQWTGSLLIAIVLLVGLAVLHDHVIRPIQTASNLLAALREGDFSLRARTPDPDDDLGLLYLEANGLAEVAPTAGDAFDPERHQAMSMVEGEGLPPGSVAQVLQKGYVLNDRLLRPALVMVVRD